MSERVKAAWSLRRRLWLSALIINVGFWLIALGMVAYSNWLTANRMIEGTLRQSARVIMSASVNLHDRGLLLPDTIDNSGNEDNSAFLLQNNESTLTRQRRRVQSQIVVDGQVLARTQWAPKQPYVEDYPGNEGFDTVQLPFRGEIQDWRVFVIKNPQYGFEIQVAVPIRLYVDQLISMGFRLLPWAIAFLTLLSVISMWVTFKLIKPINQVAESVTERSPQNLTPLVVDDLPRELVPLVKSLNEMLARLERALESERRFTADAAHELRTPLAALSMKVQLLKRQHPEAAEAFTTFTAEINRCTALIEQLLLLARLDPIHPDRQFVRNDVVLGDYLNEVMAQHQNLARQRSIQLRCVVEPDLHAQLNTDLIGIALHNLIDNAMKYGDNGCHVEISATKAGDQLRITVADNGPGVAPEHYDQLTNRFFRILGSNKTGSGLGLSIVQRVVELHDGQLSFGKGLDGKGFAVTLALQGTG